jgi:farnesyl diphosphate synthase
MLMSHSVATVLQEWRQLVNRELVTLGKGSARDSESLEAAATYVLQGPGKRLRALLAFAVTQDISRGEVTREPYSLRAGIGLEVLHAASLVHDDLPALDNDDMRRGRAACHRQFNEATAILTGDYLVGLAFSLITTGTLSPMQQLRVLTKLARAWSDLCVGQHVDIEKPTDVATIHRLMELKTGALFGAAAACGAMCADCDDETTSRFDAWGTKVGVLFQKLDDVADGDGTAAATFNRDAEVSELRSELRSLCSSPLPLTEAVYEMIVGGGL